MRKPAAGQKPVCTIMKREFPMKKHMVKKTILAALLLALALTLTACGSSGYSSGSRSNSGSGSGSGRKCAYKENGRSVCSSPAASGSNFCSYHQGYLDSIYESFVGN